MLSQGPWEVPPWNGSWPGLAISWHTLQIEACGIQFFELFFNTTTANVAAHEAIRFIHCSTETFTKGLSVAIPSVIPFNWVDVLSQDTSPLPTPIWKLILLELTITLSIIADSTPPFITYIVAQSFNAFASFPSTQCLSQAAKDALLHGIDFAALELIGLGLCALIISSVTKQPMDMDRQMAWVAKKSLPWQSCTTIWNGSVLGRWAVMTPPTCRTWVVRMLPLALVASRPSLPDKVPLCLNVACCIHLLTRETSDIYATSSLAAGQFIQYLITTLSAHILAGQTVWSLLAWCNQLLMARKRQIEELEDRHA